jgi:uncharacterized protein YndB with AHSA1/START domain
MSGNLTFVDEAMIDASPDTVFNAVLDECAGITHWWMPQYEIKPRADTPVRKMGMISDVTLHGAGTLRFSWTMTKIAEGKSIEVEYNGDFVATGEWVFEPADGKTKVKYIWKGRPNRLLVNLAFHFMDTKKLHSEAIQQGFKGLNDYIVKK